MVTKVPCFSVIIPYIGLYWQVIWKAENKRNKDLPSMVHHPDLHKSQGGRDPAPAPSSGMRKQEARMESKAGLELRLWHGVQAWSSGLATPPLGPWVKNTGQGYFISGVAANKRSYTKSLWARAFISASKYLLGKDSLSCCIFLYSPLLCYSVTLK